MVCHVYENINMWKVLGDTLRPGGFSLTEKALQLCGFNKETKILDVGCGRGATVKFLYDNYGISAVGVDPSEKLIAIAKDKHPHGEFILGKGEDLLFMKDSFDGVLAECTLSLMVMDDVLKNVYKVLKEDGFFIITDVYGKDMPLSNPLKDFSFDSCMKGLHDLNKLDAQLKKAGFETHYVEKYDHLMRQLMGEIIFSYGSMNKFWSAALQEHPQTKLFQETLAACKPGYFLLIAKKIRRNKA